MIDPKDEDSEHFRRDQGPDGAGDREGVADSETLRVGSFAGSSRSSGAQALGGQHIGPYRLLKELGRGGQGVVYLAEDTRLRREVALKTMTGLGPDAGLQMQRFRREAEVVSKLYHPGICSVLDAGVDAGVAYLAMRYVRGRTLADRISDARALAEGTEGAEASIAIDFEVSEVGEPKGGAAAEESSGTGKKSETSLGRVELRKLLEIIERSARALQAAHEQGVIHRDIKPANIMVGEDGQPVILDFGLARDESPDGGLSLTQTGDLFGTPSYMSPEQLTGQRVRLDGRSDIYSLGVTLFECLALKRPFEAPTREALYQAVLTRNPPNIRKLCRFVPADLAIVLETALEKDRERRYATAEAFADDLAAVRENRPIKAQAIGPVGRAVRFARRRPMAAALLVTVLIGLPLVTALAGYIYAHKDDIAAQKLLVLEQRVEALIGDGFFRLHHGGPEVALAAFDQAAALLPNAPEVAGGRAMALLEMKRPESAQNALAVVPARPPALQRIEARVLRALARNDEAAALEAAVETAAPSHFDAFVRGQELMQEAHEGAKDAEQDGAGELFRAAAAEFERAIALSERPRLAYFLGYAHATSHLPDAKGDLPLISALPVLWPENGWSWYWASLAAWRDPETALARIDRAAAIDPTLPTASRRSVILGDLNRHEESLAVAQKAVAADPEDEFALSALAVAEVKSERFADAEVTARRLLEVDAADLWGHTLLADALKGQRRFEEALDATKEARRRRPKDVSVHLQLSIILSELKRHEEALGPILRFLEEKPTDPFARSHLGSVYAALGELKKARDLYEALILEGQGNALIWSNLCAVRGFLGDSKGALEAARRAVEAAPENASFRVNLVSALISRNELKLAATELTHAVALAPEDSSVIGMQAELAQAEGRMADALRDLRRQVALDPSERNLARLGYALVKTSNFDEGLPHLEKAARTGAPDVLYAYAMALNDAGRSEECMEAYRRLIAANPDHPEAHCNLALYYLRQGRFEEGLPLLRRGHELGTQRQDWTNPSKTWLLQALTDSANKIKTSDPALAIGRLNEAVALEPNDIFTNVLLGTTLIAEETPKELRDPRRALFHAQHFAALTKRPPFALYVLARALAANDFVHSALQLADEIDEMLGGKDQLPFTLKMAAELRSDLNDQLASGTAK